MNFDNQTIQLGPDEIRPTTIGNVTPAIQQLMSAVQDGAISFDSINKHFDTGVKSVGDAQKTKEDIVNSRDRLALEPKIQAARVAAQDLQDSIRSLTDRSTRAKAATDANAAENTLATQPDVFAADALNRKVATGTAENALFQNDQAKLAQPTIAAGNVDNILSQQTAQSDLRMINDLHPGDAEKLDIYKKYQALGKVAPRIGKDFDYSAMKREINDVTDQKLRGATGTDLDKAGIAREVIRKAGESDADYSARVFAEPAPTDAEARHNLVSTIQNSDTVIPQLRLAREYVNDPTTEPVGPGLAQGSSENQFFTGLRAKVGGALEKNKQQAFIRNTLASQIQATIKSLMGTGNRVMQAEVDPKTGLFYKAMPAIDAPKETWNTWLNEKEELFKRAREENVSALPKSLRSHYSAGGPQAATATGTPQVFGAARAPEGAPPGVNGQGFVPKEAPEFAIYSKVATPAVTISSLRSLKPGQPYYDYNGLLRIWSPKE